MSWQKWVLVVLLSVSSLITICLIGRQRKPLEPGTAALALLINTGMIWLVVAA